MFDIDENKLDRRFLDYFTRTLPFMEQVAAQGSTNYAAIRPADVLGYDVPLPPLAEQQRVVARIEDMADQVHAAHELRRQAANETGALTTSLHIRLAAGRTRRLGEILELDEDTTRVSETEVYPQVGVRSFGAGLFPKPSTLGADTMYKRFNRLYAGAVVLSQVKGWEGAVAVCPAELSGWFVSPEYRTLRCIVGEALPGYLERLVRTKWFWSRLSDATRGVGARRERTRPEQFLGIELPMPGVEEQEQGERLFAQVVAAQHLQMQTLPALDSLLPAILARVFKGDL